MELHQPEVDREAKMEELVRSVEVVSVQTDAQQRLSLHQSVLYRGMKVSVFILGGSYKWHESQCSHFGGKLAIRTHTQTDTCPTHTHTYAVV